MDTPLFVSGGEGGPATALMGTKGPKGLWLPYNAEYTAGNGVTIVNTALAILGRLGTTAYGLPTTFGAMGLTPTPAQFPES